MVNLSGVIVLKEKTVIKMLSLKDKLVKTFGNNKIRGSVTLSTYEGISVMVFDVPISFKDFGNFSEFTTHNKANCNLRLGNDDQVTIIEKGNLTIIEIERNNKKENITVTLNTLFI